MTNNYVYYDNVRIKTDATDIHLKINGGWYSVRQLIENHVRIVDKSRQSTYLKLNKAQEKLFFEICKCYLRKRKAQFIILKARQLGFTTFIAAFISIMTLFREFQESVIIANTEKNASKIFDKYEFIYDELKRNDASITPTLQNKNGRQLVTKFTHSSINISPATKDAVRGSTITYFHGSETAFWENLEDIMAAVNSAIPPTRLNPISLVVLESTANGLNEFKEYWDNACETNGIGGGYIPLFFPWFDNPEYVEEYDGFELTDFEKERMEKYNLTLNQIAFFRQQYLEMSKDLKKVLQEYPFCPSDAFLTTGYGVFDNEAIERRKDEVRKIKVIEGLMRYEIKPINNDIYDLIMYANYFIESEAGTIRLFEKPIKGVPYVIGIDPAVGLGNDNSVAFVIRNDTKEQVAIMYSNTTPIEKFATDVVALGYFYNTALLAPECNYGQTLIRTIRKFNYPNIYIREIDASSMTSGYENQYGINTSIKNKHTMIDHLRELCEEDMHKFSIIKDYGTLVEMQSFEYDYGKNNERKDNPKLKGKGSSHDDKVLAAAITYFACYQQTTLVYEEENKNEYKLPFALKSNDNEHGKVESEWDNVFF